MTLARARSIHAPVGEQTINSDSAAGERAEIIPGQRSVRPRPREDDEAYLRSLRVQADTDIAAGR